MGAALRGRDQVHIAFGHDLAALRQPLHRPVYAFAVLAYRPRKGLCGQGLVFVGCLTQIVDKAVFETPLFALRLVFLHGIVNKLNEQPGAEYGFCAQHVF